MVLTLLEYFFYFLVTSITLSTFGYLVLSSRIFLQIEKLNFTKIFLSYLIGILVFTTVFSLISTQGRTILIFIVPILLIITFICRKHKQTISAQWEYRILTVLSTSLFLFVVAFVIKILPYVGLKDFSLVTPHSDYVFYSIISKMMVAKGQENTYTIANILTLNCSGVSPYHYAELWLSILIAKTFSVNYLLSLIFVVYPLLLGGWLLAILSLWEIFGRVTSKAAVLAILLLFVSGLHADFYYKIDFMSLTGVYSRNFLSELGDKYGFVYLLFSLSILMLHYIGIEAALIVLLMIPFVFAAAVPGIFGAFPIVIFLFKKQFEKPLRPLIIWLLSLLGYFLFYLTLGGNAGQSNDLNIDFVQSFSKFRSIENIRTSFNIVVGTSLQIIILYSLWLVYFLVLMGRNILLDLKRPIVVFVLLTFVFGLFTWACLFEVMDLVQLVNGCGILLLNAYIVYHLIQVTYVKWPHLSIVKRYFVIVFGSLILLIQLKSSNLTNHYHLENSYSDSYIQTVNTTIPNKVENGYIFIANQESTFDNVFSLLSYHKLSTQFIYMYKKQILPLCIDNFEVEIKGLPPFEKAAVDKIKKTGYFYQFVKNQQRLGQFESIDQSRLDLLDSLKVNYLALGSNTAISPVLESKFKLLTSDPSSGEQFYVRKKILE